MYDVFLSHNRLQKRWVRSLCAFLRSKGLTVFFDEDTINPGEPILGAIEQGVENSRHVILVLSPSSVKSKWVTLEAELTIQEDPDARKRSLIPVICEPLSWESVRPSIRRLNCIDLSNAVTREEQLRYIFHYLGISKDVASEELADLLSIEKGEDTRSLDVSTIADVLAWGWSGEKLLEALIELDYLTIDGLTSSHEGNPSQWAPVFMENPYTWRLLTVEPEKIVGYWHFAPLFPDEYAAAKQGKLLDSSITADRVKTFDLPGLYEVYFVQICMHPMFRCLRNTGLLFKTVFGVLDELARERILIREVCANGYTAPGRSRCKGFGLEYACEHSEHGSIYFAPIRKVLESSSAKNFPQLRERYAEAGLL